MKRTDKYKESYKYDDQYRQPSKKIGTHVIAKNVDKMMRTTVSEMANVVPSQKTQDIVTTMRHARIIVVMISMMNVVIVITMNVIFDVNNN